MRVKEFLSKVCSIPNRTKRYLRYRQYLKIEKANMKLRIKIFKLWGRVNWCDNYFDPIVNANNKAQMSIENLHVQLYMPFWD